jgi:hypothetical protein
MILNERLRSFPVQTKADSEKNIKWQKECIEAAEDLCCFLDEKVRTSYFNKKTSYNLYDDILDESDVHKVVNPYKLPNFDAPAKIQNYPIANKYIQLLVGEELNRRFEYKIVVGNSDAVSEKEKQLVEIFRAEIMRIIQEQNLDEAALQKRLEKIEQDMYYDYQDIREKTASQILKYLWREQGLKEKFNDGFKDALIAGEEIYCCDIVAGEPIVRRVNPLNLYTIRSGESCRIEDADIIVEDSYLSIGEIIDNYYEFLSTEEVRKIENGDFLSTGSNGLLGYGRGEASFSISSMESESGSFIEVNTKHSQNGLGTFDEYGNIRVIRVVWKSKRKLQKLKYYDEFGEEQKDIVDENYKANKDLGEEVETIWVNEWWEGTRIGTDIYVKIQPRPIQFRRLTNLSICASGYIGTVYNTNDGKGRSLMDRLKPYQYLYNVFMYRTELAFARFKGPIYELDLSKVPEEWQMDQWIYYAEVLGWAAIDPFREGNKGKATGQLAGNFNTTGKVLNADMGNYIQHNINMLSMLDNAMAQVAGISPQRLGAVDNRETLGGVERAVTQSSHITESWFSTHDNTKLRVLSVLLETAKFAWKGKNLKKQYILDDQSLAMLDMEGDIINEVDFDIHVTSSSKTLELEQAIKQLAQAGLQNDKLNFTQLIDIYTTESLGVMRKKIQKAEEDAIKRQQEQMQMQQQMQQEQLQAQAQNEQAKRDHELIKLDKELENEILLKQFDKELTDSDKDGIPDAAEVIREETRLKIEELKIRHDEQESDKQRSFEAKENDKERENKLKIARSKGQSVKN